MVPYLFILDIIEKIIKKSLLDSKGQTNFASGPSLEPFGWNYKPAEKHCWLIFCERKILFRLKKQAE
jgi:hypothetical protein